MDGEQFVKVAVLENQIEAQLLGSMLDQLNIPHRLRSFHDTAYNGLFQLQKGWGELFAPRQFKIEISDILFEVRSHSSI